MYQLAADHLSRIDGDWARLVERVGPCTHVPKPAREPYEALVRAVAYQQLHARAGDAILARLLDRYPERKFPAPGQLLATEVEALRACGFSARKIETIRSIAQNTLAGVVPSRADADRMEDDELVARLVQLRGIGRWTADMLLIYTLERMDIMPADDFGVRRGYQLLKSLDVTPGPRQIEKAGLACSPYRTVASWYLWRIPSLRD